MGGGGAPYIRTSVARQYIYIGILVYFDSLFYWLDLLSSFESSFLKILNICGSHVCPRTEHIYAHWGEGGYSDNILYKGVFGAGTAQKGGGVLRCWHSAKNGGLSCGHNQKEGGGARCGYKPEIVICKRGGLTGTEVAQKGGIWSLFIYYLHF